MYENPITKNNETVRKLGYMNNIFKELETLKKHGLDSALLSELETVEFELIRLEKEILKA